MFRKRQRDAAAVTELTDETFLPETTGGYTFVDFWAPWCAPCRHFSPAFEQAASDHGDRVRFASVNVDDNPATAALLQVRTIPTVVLFDPDGNELGRVVNPPPRAFNAMVRDVIEKV